MNLEFYQLFKFGIEFYGNSIYTKLLQYNMLTKTISY